MPHLFALLLLAAALPLAAQKYTGTPPPKADIPYLKHASDLIEPEVAKAVEDKKGNQITYIIEGASSPVETPLASPIFILRADKLIPDRLELYKLEVKSGRRQITFAPKKGPPSIRISTTRFAADNIWQIEVEESLEPGEYSLTPQESNQTFCFKVR